MFDAAGGLIDGSGRGGYHQARSGLGLTLTPDLNRDGTVTVASHVAGPSNARTGNVLFSMNGDVHSLANLVTPAQRENLPLPPPLTVESELALLRKEVLALKQAREQPATSKSGGRTKTRRPPPSTRGEGERAQVFSRLGPIIEIDSRGNAFIVPHSQEDRDDSNLQGRGSSRNQQTQTGRTEYLEDSATTSSARTPGVRRGHGDAQQLQRDPNKGKGPAAPPRSPNACWRQPDREPQG